VVSVTPRPRFTPFGTHWKRGWVGSRAGLDAGARRKILFPCRGSNPDRSARSQTLYCLSYRGSSRSNIHFENEVKLSAIPLSMPVSRNHFFQPAAHPNLSKTHDGTPENFASRNGSTKLYMYINMYLQNNTCPTRMQAYQNKT
jgi:hypothetical protein